MPRPGLDISRTADVVAQLAEAALGGGARIAMTRTIVFIHGAWVTRGLLGPVRAVLRGEGLPLPRAVVAGQGPPGRGHSRRSVAARRRLASARSSAHYEAVIRGLDQPPILIGHSFGGLFTQILLDRGLGAAGVAIDSAPPKGVWAYEPTALRSLLTTLLHWRVWRKVVRWKYSNFRYAFVHTLPEAEARAAYDRYVIPEIRPDLLPERDRDARSVEPHPRQFRERHPGAAAADRRARRTASFPR